MTHPGQQKRVKILRNTSTGESIMVRRPTGVAEVQVAELCYRHPSRNIVRMLQTPRQECIKMQYYPKENLNRYLTSIRHQPRTAHLHKHEIAHRNLCLRNIYLTNENKCKVGNFGLAQMDGWKCTGQVGSLPFRAPEIFTQSSYDGLAVDMWSLGVVLFALFTGMTPFHSAIDTDVRFQKLEKVGIRSLIFAWNLNIPSTACDLLERLLCIDPESRMTAQEALKHPFLMNNY